MSSPGAPEMSLAQPTSDLFAPAAIQTLFWKPRFIAPSPVLAHVPFLFWLAGVMRPRRAAVLGAGDGVAHFVLCQAADKMYATGGHVTGFGFWLDSGSGKPLERPPVALRDHEALLYSDVSELTSIIGVPEALDALSPGDLDLLFVDLDALPAVYEPDLEDWDDKVTASGVILVHGTKEVAQRQPKGAVLMRQLRAQCDLEFRVGNGLSMIIRGNDHPARLRNLLTTCERGVVPSEVEQVFKRLGEGLGAAALQATMKASFNESKSALDKLQRSHASLTKSLNETNEAYALRNRNLADLQAKLFDKEAELTELRTTTATLKTEAQSLRAELASAETEAKTAAGALESERTARSGAEQSVAALRADLDALRQALDTREAELSAARDALSESTAKSERQDVEAAQLTRMLEDARITITANADRAHAAETEAQSLRAELASAEAEAKTAAGALESERTARSVAEASMVALHEQMQKISGQLEYLQRDRDVIAQGLQETAAHNQAILDSTSWRVTAPMRKIKTALKGK